jgi:hypothetical protein
MTVPGSGVQISKVADTGMPDSLAGSMANFEI